MDEELRELQWRLHRGDSAALYQLHKRMIKGDVAARNIILANRGIRQRQRRSDDENEQIPFDIKKVQPKMKLKKFLK